MINLEVLTRPFPQTDIKQRKNDAGKTFDYVETHSVITRLNEAFEGSWSYRILQHQIVEDEVIVLGELSAHGFTKQQFGSAILDKERPGGLNIGDTFKAAASDAMKKCATEFGVALELYASDISSGDTSHESDEFLANQPATDKQRAFLEKIAQREDLSTEDRVRIQSALTHDLTKSDASDLISNYARKRAA